MSKKLFCILGMTASGKSSISEKVADNLNLNILKSFTTRERRANETEHCDHTFISEDEVDKYRHEMVAYTERVGYCSFATATQVLENDIYIINPSGFIDLKIAVREMNLDVELVDIWINTSYQTLRERAKGRGDFDSWNANWINEHHEFVSYPSTKSYVVNNELGLEVAVHQVEEIIKKEMSK